MKNKRNIFLVLFAVILLLLLLLFLKSKNNNIEKLKYLYIEYFDQKEENISKAYNDLIESLNSMDDKHIVLYNLLKLTCKK